MKDYEQFLTALTKLISYKSVLGEQTDDAPFGNQVKDALIYFLDLANSFGFETINYDNYAGEVVFGQGEEIGVIGHLDVVPVGIGWNTDPWTLTEIDGTFFGRGVMDDKSPLLSCLFALKELKDSGISPKRKIRLIAGCDEESGWRDVQYLKNKTTLPEYGFSPDGNFPLSYAEKGIVEATFSLPLPKNFSSIKGGTVLNAVCDFAEATVKDDAINLELIKKHNLTLKNGNVIQSFGKAAHGSTPHLGKNAIKPLLNYMYDLGEFVLPFIEYLFEDKLGVGKLKTEQGYVTMSPNLLYEKDGKLNITCDLRIPAPLSLNDLMPTFEKFNLSVKTKVRHDPVLVEKDGWFVKTLLSAHDSVTGKVSQPISMGGSTFSRAFNKGCAFGPEVDGHDSKIHDANENVSIEHLIKCYQIYKLALEKLLTE